MKLAFMHIPKTGGISVERAVEGAQGADLDVCPLYRPAEFQGKIHADLPGHDFYKGHFDMQFLASVPDDYKKVTVLRRPEDLLLSLYNHITSRPAHALHEASTAPDTDFATLVRTNKGLHNTLAKYVLGRHDYARICGASDQPPAARIEAALAQARINLARFDLIGMTPRLGRFVSTVGELVGQPLPAPRHENKSPTTTLRKEAMTEQDHAAMHRATWVDRPLFRMAWSTFLAPAQPRDRAG